MKRNILCAAMVLVAGSLLAADKDDVSAGIAKLAAADNYSWKSAPAAPPGGGGGGGRRGGFGGGPVDGKTQKDGLVYVSMSGRGGNTTEGYVQKTKGAIKTQDGWQSIAEATKDDGGGGFNPGTFAARRVQGIKAPAEEAKEYLEKTKSITKADDAYTGELTEEGAKAMIPTFRPPGGGDGPAITKPGGSVKFWLKDGVLSKYEYTLKYHMNFNDNDIDIDRTTTVEIKDVGATKIEVPDDAKKKLSS